MSASSSSQSVTVRIRVTGPKSILPRGALATKECNVNGSWFEFLTDGCNLQIQPDSPILVSTLSRNTTRKGKWEANLGDTVKDFLSKFSRPPHPYNVRLITRKKQRAVKISVPRTPRRLSIITVPSRSESLLPGTKSLLKPTNRQPQDQVIMPLLLSGSVMVTQPTYNQNAYPSPPSPARRHIRKIDLQSDPQQQQQVDPVGGDSDDIDAPMNLVKGDGKENGNTNPPDDISAQFKFSILNLNKEDAMSQSTSASSKMQELQRDGIQFQEIKANVITKFAENFDNTAMLRIQDELKQLVQYGKWHKVTRRVPRTGHFLQEIFEILSTC